MAIFFVLSGFLLSRLLDRAHRRRAAAAVDVALPVEAGPAAGPGVRRDRGRAALTLLPGNRGAGVGDSRVTTLLLANIYVDDHLPDGLTQMWSLSTEVAFYAGAAGPDVARALPRPGGPTGDRIGPLALAMAATTSSG